MSFEFKHYECNHLLQIKGTVRLPVFAVITSFRIVLLLLLLELRLM